VGRTSTPTTGVLITTRGAKPKPLKVGVSRDHTRDHELLSLAKPPCFGALGGSAVLAPRPRSRAICD